MSKTILLVEDDDSISQMLGRVLEMEHYKVASAETVHKAVSNFLHEGPDLVLLDLDLPEEGGWRAFELMEKMRPFVRVIVITGFSNELERASELGVDALMQKPLNLPLLLRTVQNLVHEPDPERLARITSRSFRTRLLAAEDAALEVDYIGTRDAWRGWGINE